jgi:hypothetical protein
MLLGIGVLVLGQVLYFVDLVTPGPQAFLDESLLLTPGIASLCSTAFAPEKKIAAGLSMALVGPIIAMIAWSIYQLLGIPTDRIGGLTATFAIVLGYHAVACSVGTGIGYAIGNWSRRLYG